MQQAPLEPMNQSPELSVVRPDDLLHFRLARLLLLLDVVEQMGLDGVPLERLGFCDFFADNPHLIATNSPLFKRDLILAGFEDQSLSYHSSAQRFTNRREKLQHDLAHLLAYDAVRARAGEGFVVYSISDLGKQIASNLNTLYARSYRSSAGMIIARLRRLSDTRLQESAREWLKAESFLIDIFDIESSYQ